MQSSGELKATEKVVRVIEALARSDQLSAIAETSGVATSTVHRILQELVAVGWASEGEDHRYRPGARFVATGLSLGEMRSVVRLIMPELRRLRERTGYTVHYVGCAQTSLVYLAKLNGRQPYSMASRVGDVVGYYSTASGKAILSQLPPLRVRAMIAKSPLVRLTPGTIVDPVLFERELEVSRRRGFAVDTQENEEGVCCVGAAVLDEKGGAIGGVSVSLVKERLPDDVAMLLGREVAAIARRVGLVLRGEC